MIRSCLLLLLSLFILQACQTDRREHPGKQRDSAGPTEDPAYARGFRIEREEHYSVLHVMDPWQGSSGVHLRYLLARERGKVPDTLPYDAFIPLPVKRVICMSTTHLAMISALGEAGSIAGVSGTQYINDPDLKQGIRSGEIADVGADQSLNYERIVALDPDLVVAYGITAEVNGMVRRLGEIGIPVVLDGDYLENEPLGKTEWLKFLACLYEKSALADSLFRDIEDEYERLRGLVRGVSEKPLVMTGLPWKDIWYIPGGKSFAAAFIRDAGGEYLWADVDSREAAPVDLESVFSRGLRADIWINSGSARSLEDIRQIEPRLASFPTVKAAKVYNNTARSAPGGGNDFWEKGVMEPQIVLADLIHIFHPGLLPGHKLRYYERLK